MTALTKEFDSAVTSPGGDAMLTAVNPATPFAPVVICPGHTAVIKVTIRPSGAPGTTVRGIPYVDDVTGDVPPFGQVSGNELGHCPTPTPPSNAPGPAGDQLTSPRRERRESAGGASLSGLTLRADPNYGPPVIISASLKAPPCRGLSSPPFCRNVFNSLLNGHRIAVPDNA